jgi:hypothetical protein
MIEEDIALILLIYGIFTQRPESFIAAGLFAIACNLHQMWRLEKEIHRC